MVGSVLPLGVALIAVCTPMGVVELVSNRLSATEATVAHLIALYQLRYCKTFLLKERELAEVLEAA